MFPLTPQSHVQLRLRLEKAKKPSMHPRLSWHLTRSLPYLYKLSRRCRCGPFLGRALWVGLFYCSSCFVRPVFSNIDRTRVEWAVRGCWLQPSDLCVLYTLLLVLARIVRCIHLLRNQENLSGLGLLPKEEKKRKDKKKGINLKGSFLPSV